MDEQNHVGYVFYYHHNNDLSYVYDNFQERGYIDVRSTDKRDVISFIPNNDFHYYDINSYIALARISNRLIKAHLLLEEGSEGRLVYEEELSFAEDTIPGMLNTDVFSIVSSQLSERQKYSFKTTSKLYQKELSPVKWQVKAKGISSATFSSLRDIYSLGQIVQLFIQFPDVIETCIDAGYDYKQPIDTLSSVLPIFANPFTDNLVKYCINTVYAYDTAKMIIKKFNLDWRIYTNNMTFGLIMEDTRIGKSKLSQKEQWNLLHNNPSIHTILTKGLSTFSYEDNNVLSELMINKQDDNLIMFLSRQEGIEKNFSMPLKYIIPSLVDIDMISALLNNPLLFSKEQLLEMLKYYLLIDIEETQVQIIIACIVAIRGYDISDYVTNINCNSFILEDRHFLNILRCTRNKSLIDTLEGEFISKYYRQAPYPEYMYYYSDGPYNNKKADAIKETLVNILQTHCTPEELSNCLVENVNYSKFASMIGIVPSRVANFIFDIIPISGPYENKFELSSSYIGEVYDAYSIGLYLEKLFGKILPNNNIIVNHLDGNLIVDTDKCSPQYVRGIVKRLLGDIYHGKLVIPLYIVLETYTYLDSANIDAVLNAFHAHLLDGVKDNEPIVFDNYAIDININGNNLEIKASSVKDTGKLLKLLLDFSKFYFRVYDKRKYISVMFGYKGDTLSLIESIKSICDKHGFKPNLGYQNGNASFIVLESEWKQIKDEIKRLTNTGCIIVSDYNMTLEEFGRI